MKLETSEKKIEEFTDGQIELLKELINGCNIALYRTGQIRMRDKNHNPIKNIRSDMFEKIREWTVQQDGLFYINPDMIQRLPMSIQKG